MGTTAQKLQAIIDSKLDIKDAIEAKGVTVGDAAFDEYASKIEAIPTPIEEAPENDVNFYDYDGRRIASYTIDEAKALTQAEYNAILPPAHDGLTFQEWNWSLADITSYNRRYIDIGANYVPTDGYTHIITEVTAGEDVLFILSMDTGISVVVSWGDGTSSTSTTGTNKGFAHTYNTAGKYDISIIDTQTSSSAKYGLLNTHIAVFGNLKEIRIGNHYNFAFTSNSQNLNCLISIPTSVALDAMDIRFSSVPILVIPKGAFDFTLSNAFRCFNGKLSFPKQVAGISASNLFILSTYTRLVLPEYTTGSVAASALQSLYWLKQLSLPVSFGWAASGTFFSNGYALCELDIVQGWVPNYSIVLSGSLKWSAANMVDFFTKLGTTQTAITLTFGAVNLYRLTDEEKAVATNKGYTLA